MQEAQSPEIRGVSILKHLDLFSGIGGFSLACEWAGIETICFVEIDKFCQKVLRKHWPNVPIVKDVNNVEEIKRIVANTEQQRPIQCQLQQRTRYKEGVFAKHNSNAPNASCTRLERQEPKSPVSEPEQSSRCDRLLLTAGFPCQPFSAAGQRKGSADDRYLWPQTLAVIEAVKPDWVLLENVAGILSMVFPDSSVGVASQASFCEVPNDEISDYDTISGRIDGDLSQAGYETVWLVIPACAVNAPHRRDRVWVVAHNNRAGNRTPPSRINQEGTEISKEQQQLQSERSRQDSDVGNPISESRRETSERRLGVEGNILSKTRWDKDSDRTSAPGWDENWYEVAAHFCRVDARISDRVDRLKALGNAIVPQVAYQIIKAIVEADSLQGS